MRRRNITAALGLALVACSDRGAPGGTLGTDASFGRLHFTDVTAKTGIDFTLTSGRTPSTQILEVKGGGLAALDFDQDGDVDLFAPNGATLEAPDEGPGCVLFANDGGLVFRDATRDAGLSFRRWGFGCAVADVDGDGAQDVYVCCYGKNALLSNRGGRFVETTDAAGVGCTAWSTAAAFGDVDQDGDLDLYVANYLDFDVARPPGKDVFLGVSVFAGPSGLPPAPDVLYRNRGDGTFEDWSEESGIRRVAPSYGLGVVILDFDDDGRQDVFVGNDSVPNFLFTRRADGTFEEVAARSDLATDADGHAHATMGIAIGDVDGDLRPDVFTTSFMNDTDTLYRNRSESGAPAFVDRTTAWGLGQITRPFLSWACEFADFDHDADEDLVIFNGHVYPEEITGPHGWDHEQRPELFERAGDRFRPVGAEAGGAWLDEKHCDRSACVTDLDEDGDVDIVVGALNGKIRVLENDGARGPWLEVALADRRPGAKNRDGLGARVVLETPGAACERQVRFVKSGGSYQSAVPPRVHFGVPIRTTTARLVVTWPDAVVQAVEAVAPGRRITVERRD